MKLQTKVVPLALCITLLMLRGALPAYAMGTIPVESPAVPAGGFHSMVQVADDDPFGGDDSDDTDDDDDDDDGDGGL